MCLYFCRNVARPNSQFELATRFIALASVGNAEKSKFIYALNVTAVDKMRLTDLIQKTTNEIPCPYDSMQFSTPGLKSAINATESQQYFYDFNTAADRSHKKRGKFNHDNSGQQKRPRLPNFDQGFHMLCQLIPECSLQFILVANSFVSISRKMLVLFIITIGGEASCDYNW